MRCTWLLQVLRNSLSNVKLFCFNMPFLAVPSTPLVFLFMYCLLSPQILGSRGCASASINMSFGQPPTVIERSKRVKLEDISVADTSGWRPYILCTSFFKANFGVA